MATRSTIAKANTDGTVTAIYCHWDGYPEGVGATLKEHYTDSTKIDSLLALGDLSVLGNEIGDRNDFENPVKNVCLFYGRDRGETNVDAVTHESIDAWKRHFTACDYGYLWTGTEWTTYKDLY
jgi:hypothetical protein